MTKLPLNCKVVNGEIITAAKAGPKTKLPLSCIVVNGTIVARVLGPCEVSSELYHEGNLVKLAQSRQTVKDGQLVTWYQFA